jgi:hypothetical protein
MLQHWPRLTRFYGISPFELQHLPYAITRIYISALPELEAEEQLSRIQAASFPHMEEKSQKKIHRRLAALVGIEEETVKLNPHDDVSALAALGIGAVIEDA